MSFDFEEICKNAVRYGASDIHMTVASPPVLRIQGKLAKISCYNLTPKDTESVLKTLCTGERFDSFKKTGQCDFSYSIPGVGRFRVNVFRQRGSAAMCIRVLSPKVPTLESLAMPEVVGKLGRQKSGLVLIAGSTGSGKSTTLAALVDQINSLSCLHIITLEDPIEFLHPHKKSIVNQREIGSDTISFLEGVRAALREDPDVIVIGELRDYETVTTALSAGGTGHLVLGTVHAPGADGAVMRLTDLFPIEYREQANAMISTVLVGVVAQKLLTRADKAGRVPACEILINTPETGKIIREGKMQLLKECIEKDNKHGMVTMEQSVRNLFENGVIDQSEYESNM